MTHSRIHLEKLRSDQLMELAEFVVSENFKHHTVNEHLTNYEDEVNSIFEEETTYFKNADIFVSRDAKNDMIGSIRVLRWNLKDILPLQKIFGINPLLLNNYGFSRPTWHIGRFAIKKGTRDICLLKQLMICAIEPICQDKNAIAYAECDSKLLGILHALGIQAYPIGEPISYLGSQTIPVTMSHPGLIDFYQKNRSLVRRGVPDWSGSLAKLPKSVVLPPWANNYSLV